jgi:hypothetical protein
MENFEQFQDQKSESNLENEISPDLVRALEEADFNIDDKVNLLLTKAGLKPASEISFFIKSYEGKEVTKHMTEGDVKRDLWLIKEFGLVTKENDRKIVEEKYKTKDGEIKTYKRAEMHVLVAKNKEDLEFLINAIQSNDDELLGRAYGFPPTAIEAWVGKGKRKRLRVNDLPEAIQQSDAMLFSSPILSADNWQEEIKYGKKCADYIRKLSPTIYRDMLEMMKKAGNNYFKRTYLFIITFLAE